MKDDPTRLTVQQKMQVTLGLFDASVEIMKQNLRRRYPDETDEQRHQRFLHWLHKGTTFEPPREPNSGEEP